jgi:DNA-binding response OmpR family regulator
MANVKQILLVDDHFEMLEFLRSMLELSGQDYEVLAVPSAEEGLLELQRTNFDLLITDVRLPGMSGFDLVRRVRKLRPNMATIMITAYSTAQGRKEAEVLNVYRYFTKPLDTDAVLAAVYAALYGETAEPPTNTVFPHPSSPTAVSTRVQHRLNSLRADTGATGLFLANLDGKILYRASSNNRDINLDELVAVVTRNIENNFNLAQTLGGEVPFTIQYHAGTAYELYNANIGRRYFIAMYFDVTSRRGRIGTIWVFAQRAIKDLSKLLPEIESVATAPRVDEKSAASPASAAPAEVPSEPGAPAKSEPAAAPQPLVPEAVEGSKEGEIDYDAERALIDQIPSWSELEAESVEQDINGLLDILNLSEGITGVDLDSFWDEATVETDDTNGISFEEALKRGLISLSNRAKEEEEDEA